MRLDAHVHTHHAGNTVYHLQDEQFNRDPLVDLVGLPMPGRNVPDSAHALEPALQD